MTRQSGPCPNTTPLNSPTDLLSAAVQTARGRSVKRTDRPLCAFLSVARSAAVPTACSLENCANSRRGELFARTPGSRGRGQLQAMSLYLARCGFSPGSEQLNGAGGSEEAALAALEEAQAAAVGLLSPLHDAPAPAECAAAACHAVTPFLQLSLPKLVV
eukprot:365353-Chlamydomonas_euryale.AAC.18